MLWKENKALFKVLTKCIFGGNIKTIIKHIVCTFNQGSFH